VDGTFSPLPWSKPTTKEAVLDARYDRRDAMVRSILCLMASQRPLSFKSNTPIPIAKEFSHYNASDFHHVFPRGWLKTTGRSDWVKKEHSLANICFSPAREQRHEIRAKPPSEYINMFAATNPGIDLALASHVMGGVLKPLLVKDQFEEFLEKRASAIADLLNKNAHA
jgi:hypothetical protein